MNSDNNNNLPPAIFLMGPTASGKTQIAVELVQCLPLEIISVDSALVYRGMDIGSAKPDAQTLAIAPHRLIDIRDPSETYSAADFRNDALREMANITAQGKIPLLVGGTMLYFKTLLEGMAELPETDPAVRAQVDEEAKREGWPAMHKKLAEVDPELAAKLHPNHSQRIGRALEVYRITGTTMSALRAQQTRQAFPYKVLQLAIAPRDRDALNQRIDARFQSMMDAGFLDEVASLYKRPDLHAELPALRAVGYRQAWAYLDQDNLSERLTREQMIERAMIASRQLAKRQFTWLRSWQNLQWVYYDPEAGGVVRANRLESIVADIEQRVRSFTGLTG